MQNELQNVEENPLAILGQMDMKTIDPDKVEKLLSLQERWEDRQAEKAYNEALHLFQAECPQIHKDSQAHNSSYAKLEKVNRVIRPFMDKHGFSASFDIETNGDDRICGIVCNLRHVAGHSTKSRFPLAPDKSGSKNDIQALGSAQSYGMRYSLAAALGLVFTDEDDDGQSSDAVLIPEEQADSLLALMDQMEELEPGSKGRFLGAVGVASIFELPSEKFDQALRTLNNKIVKLQEAAA